MECAFLEILIYVRRNKSAQNRDCVMETAVRVIKDCQNAMETDKIVAQEFLQLILKAHDDSKETKSSGYLNNKKLLY